jgi:small subunit ribosomal protein S17
MANKQNNKTKGRVMKGQVASDKMNKTVVVAVSRLKEHPIYRKRYKITKRYKAHDEKNECKIGDIVLIGETKPMSKDKRWRVIEVIKKVGEKSGDEENSESLKQDL